MSPESILAPDDIDARSDLYAVGAVGYWLLTGRTVFEARSSVEVCYHHLHTPPDPPSKYAPGAVPPDLERVLLDCLAKDADGRPPDALTLEDRLASCVSAPGWSDADARRWWKTQARAHETQRRTGHPPRTLDVDLQDRIAAAVSPSLTAR
jgi:serine/threonine-protein kinase